MRIKSRKRARVVTSKPSRISHVVKNMPEVPEVRNIAKYVGVERTHNVMFKKANHLV